MTASAFVYRVYSLNLIGVIISLFLAVAVVIIILIKKTRKYSKTNISIKPRIVNKTVKKRAAIIILSIIYPLLTISCFFLLSLARTSVSIVSPWQVVSPLFFILFFLASIILLLIIALGSRLSLFFISIHFLLFSSVAIIIYRLGYGFDVFIHQATLDLIKANGSVFPKPLYYLGQYGLIITLNTLFHLPIAWLNACLVPILAAITLPSALFIALSNWFKNKKNILLAIVPLLSLPLTIFMLSTPQNLAWVLLLLIILLGLVCRNHFDLIVLFSLATAALFTHPVAGIPAFLFVILIAIYHSGLKRIKTLLYIIVFTMLAIALPLSFSYVEKQNIVNTDSITSSSPLVTMPSLANPQSESFIYNSLYLFGFNLPYFFIILMIFGLAVAFTYREYCRKLYLYLFCALALLLSYFLSSHISFKFLIGYERGDYLNRILLTSLLFSIPFIALAFYGFIDKLMRKNLTIKIAFLFFAGSLISAGLYFNYPRYDPYFNSHGYSVGTSDIAAVSWINNSAKNDDYIVLANQQVSAAALHEFGFKKYFNTVDEETFYYPIPTGGALYQFYLDMVYKKPSRETMLKAMELTGVNEAYFVLNNYWWAFPKILAEAKLEADSFKEFDNNKIYVFKYSN